MVLHEYPINIYTPQQDEYRPIESKDKIIGEQDIDNDSSDEDLENEQHYDFNVIASVEKKIGRIPYQSSKSIKFLSMIEDCGLVDHGFYGPKYTWSNGRGLCSIVWKRLDRGLANDQWLEMFPAATVSHLASTGLDHTPLLLELHIRTALNEVKAQYVRYLKIEQDVLKQKTHLQWIKEGDANSRYFHSLIRGRRGKLFIHKIKNEEGEWIQGDENTREAAYDYFQNLFSNLRK
ncbi:uncharacterized protein LOC142181762 [Nicotiana tabacum]|uniref:Uncharacterized protein LOC142181762 n=1 Tax=Nicotiana tabacum TaxID=4097 RepID=A0AC58UPH1_TOBAC